MFHSNVHAVNITCVLSTARNYLFSLGKGKEKVKASSRCKYMYVGDLLYFKLQVFIQFCSVS